MPNSKDQEQITIGGFSNAFEQMCNFMAVAKTGDPDATVLGLTQLSFTLFDSDNISSAEKIVVLIENLFSIKIPSAEIQRALDALYDADVLSREESGRYVLSPAKRAEIQARIDDAVSLEARVRSKWIAQVIAEFPKLDAEKIWLSLRGYLLRAFRRHGIQTAALLDPAVRIHPRYEASLATLLQEAVKEHFGSEHFEAERAVAGFLAELGRDQDRANYITHLADAAFSFYSLQVSPEIAHKLRERLSELVLFLDTNFLFGILDFHYNSQSDVSHDLLRAIKKHKLPFKLRFHEATGDEMRRTINSIASILRARVWTRPLSRAAARTRQLTGIEQKFHEQNAEHYVDIDEFLRPIQHFDALLAEKDIKIYRPSEKRVRERGELYNIYKEFLDKHGRTDKTYETVQHDATILDATRLLRTKVRSTLEAGALLVTCDYLLYKFDRSTSHEDQLPSVVLPNVLWQLLRPFITTDADFERAFAETFALPEFRAVGSGGAKACTRMLSILATYKNFPEETAFKLMTDGMLVSRLRATSSEQEFAAVMESAIVEENNDLLEETIALKKKVADDAEKLKKIETARQEHEVELQSARQEVVTLRGDLDGEKSRVKQIADREVAQSQTIGGLEAQLRRNALLGYLLLLLFIVAISLGLAWWGAAQLPWLVRTIGQMLTISLLWIVGFIICHLLIELFVRKYPKITDLWPFVQVRRFRRWLWSFLVLVVLLNICLNLVANRVQKNIDRPALPTAVHS